MGAPRLNPLKSVSFRCKQEGCKVPFEAEPDLVEPDDSQDFHPWRYVAKCPKCGGRSEQAAWERNLLKAYAKATGPKTPEGIAKVTANLEGHPTAEESKRTRWNATKHGLYLMASKYFPARPGKYQACNGCRYLNNGCSDISEACMLRVEVFMRHQLAYDENNPRLLMQDNIELQAAVRGIVNEILLAITRRGVELVTPQWYYDKDGRFHLAQYTPTDGAGEPVQLMEVRENPLLKILIEIMRANGMTLPDDGMTMRASEQDSAMTGFLDAQRGQSEQLLEFEERRTKAMENLTGLIERSRQKTNNDPVLIEYRQGEGVPVEGGER